MMIQVTSDYVEQVVSQLIGRAGISSIDKVKIQAWLWDHGVEILVLGQELAEWAVWIANKSLTWAVVSSLLANLLFALDKKIGTRPVA